MAFRISYVISAILVALLAGSFFGTWWGIEPNIVDNAHDYTHVHQLLNQVYGSQMPFFFLGTIAALGTTAFLLYRGNRGGFVLAAIACACVVTMLATTLLGNVPANAEFDTWSAANPPADWMSWRDRWELFHNVRVVLGIIAIGSLASVAVVGGERRTRAASTAEAASAA